MTVIRLLLAGLALAAGAAAIVFDRQGRRPHVYIGRVAAMLFTILAAVLTPHPFQRPTGSWSPPALFSRWPGTFA